MVFKPLNFVVNNNRGKAIHPSDPPQLIQETSLRVPVLALQPDRHEGRRPNPFSQGGSSKSNSRLGSRHTAVQSPRTKERPTTDHRRETRISDG